MCEIPFMVWMSPYYRKSRPDLIFDTGRPYSTENFIYSISDIAGISYKDYDDTKSVFSMNFEQRERFVGEKKYEDIKEKFKE